MPRSFRIPDVVLRSLGPESEPLWYAGALQVDGRDIDPLPLPEGSDPGALRAHPLRIAADGGYPDGDLTEEEPDA